MGTLSILEPTPIDPTRIVTVPKVPFASSPLGKIKDEKVLAALCDVLRSHESCRTVSSSTPIMFGLSPKMTSLLSEVESLCNDTTEDDDFSKNHEEDIGVWIEEGIQQLRNSEISGDCTPNNAFSSSSAKCVIEVDPNRRNRSPCCSPEPSCDTTTVLPAQSKSSSTSSDTSRSEFPMIGDTTTTSSTSPSSSTTTFRINQTEQWYQRYLEMVKFRETHGHCLVPLNWPNNPSLAHWVKRQRHQYRAKKERKHSTLTAERERLLEELGFVWDSHASGWEERLNELRDFKDKHGHCRVPKTYAENPQLAIWVKCQRRQFKLYSEGKDSNMTNERIHKLKRLGFVFTPRKQQQQQSLCTHV